MEQEKKELVARGYQFYCKGKEYYTRNEVEGALINFLLALNTFDILKKLHVPTTSLSKDLKDLTLKCPLTENIDSAIDTLTRYIAPLQDQLKRLKSTRATAEEDDNDCSTVSNYTRKVDDMITFDDISGQETTKSQLKSCLLYPLLYTRLFPQLSKGILLYGAPGTGKTMFAKAFVTELEMTAKEAGEDISIILYTPTGADLKGKYVGDTEKNISKYFDCAATRATECQTAKKNGRAISVIFMDEIEAIAGNRDDDSTGMMTNSVNTLLQKMDGVNSYKNVIVMAATNYPWKLDEAILRRFDTKIHVTLPAVEDIILLLKTEIVKKYFKPILRKDDEEKTLEEPLPDPTACPTSPGFKEREDIAQMFDSYREEYFKDFEEADIRQYAKKLYPRYSAGDVANICKWVFRKMGARALKDNRWDIHHKKLQLNEKYALYDPDNGQELGDSVIPQEDTNVPKEITIDGEVWIHSDYVVPILRREGLKEFKDMNQKLDFIRSFYSLNTQNNKSYECFYVQKEFIKAKIEKKNDVPETFELLVKQTIDMVNITAKRSSFKPSFYVLLKCSYEQTYGELYSKSKNKMKHLYRSLWNNYTAIDEDDVNAPPALPKDAGAFYVPTAFYIEQATDGDSFTFKSYSTILENFDESPLFFAFKRGLLYIPDDAEYRKLYKTSHSYYGKQVNEIQDGKIIDMIDFLESVLKTGKIQQYKVEMKIDLTPRKEKLKASDISNKYKLNLKFSIDDFYNAINTGKTDTIKPTVAPTKLALLQKYEQTGLLSKEDLTKAKEELK